MATTHGKDGAVYVGANLAANITGWSGTYDGGFADTSALQDSYKSQIGGLISMTGSLNCNTDFADTNGQVAIQTALTGQTTARLYLCITSTKYWEFDANINQVGDTIDIGDVVKRVVNFMSNGTITAPS
jgi:hypothetical protein